MSWAKKDDQWARHPKVRKAGRDARALWDVALTECCARDAAGIVDALGVKDAAYLAEVKRPAAAAASLVDVALWHDATTINECDRCLTALAGRELGPGDFYFHDWSQYQLSKAPSAEANDKEARRRRLGRNDRLKRLIRDRDGSLCRYCAKRVNFDDHRSDDGGTYDHVNPDGDNALDNVVVACRGCNILKGERTPAEAGMELLAPGTTKPDLVVVAPKPFQPVSNPRPETVPTPAENGPEKEPARFEPETNPAGTKPSPRARARTSPDGSEPAGNRAGSGPENGSEPDRVGSGPGPGPTPQVSAETQTLDEESA